MLNVYVLHATPLGTRLVTVDVVEAQSHRANAPSIQQSSFILPVVRRPTFNASRVCQFACLTAGPSHAIIQAIGINTARASPTTSLVVGSTSPGLPEPAVGNGQSISRIAHVEAWASLSHVPEPNAFLNYPHYFILLSCVLRVLYPSIIALRVCYSVLPYLGGAGVLTGSCLSVLHGKGEIPGLSGTRQIDAKPPRSPAPIRSNFADSLDRSTRRPCRAPLRMA